MPTTLALITPVLLARIDAAPGGWRRVKAFGALTEPESDFHYRCLPDGGPDFVEIYGRHAEQVLAQTFVLHLYRVLDGDPHVEEPAFIDAARPVGDAIEKYEAWPEGVSCVKVVSRGGIERGYDGAGEQFARIAITIRVEYAAAFNEQE